MNDFFLVTSQLFSGFSPSNRVEISDLNLNRGQIVSLLGRNGAGKSMFLQTLSRQIPAQKGQIFIQKKPIHSFSPPAWAQLAALVNTDKIQADFLTGQELVNLGLYPRLGFWAKPNLSEQAFINDIFNSLEIDFLASKRLNHCSDGEKQLLQLARALAQRTDLLILDEITAHLDFANRRKVFAYLQNIARQANKLIFIATHELDLAAAYSDKLLIFQANKAVFGDLADLR